MESQVANQSDQSQQRQLNIEDQPATRPKPTEQKVHDKKTKLMKYIEKLSEESRFTEAYLWKWHESFHKSCPNGKASLGQFKMFYKTYYANRDAGEFAGHVFRTIKKKDPNYVEFGELVKAGDVIIKGDKEEKLRWIFSMYDMDDDSLVKRVEMFDVHLSAYNMVLGRDKNANPSHHVDYIFRNVDKNLDGKLTFEEFQEGTSKSKAVERMLAM